MNYMFLTLGLMLLASPVFAEPQTKAILNAVVERGKHVMPFHLEKTKHVFTKTSQGGLQQVIVNDASDVEQIGLIRQHLSDISTGFRQGDFSPQRYIHGDDMPGIAELAADYRRVNFDFRKLPNGAEIEYSTEDPALVDAIHRYFNAQLSDHGRHSVGEQTAQCQHKPHRHGESKSILPQE